jgi:hypothetical protein
MLIYKAGLAAGAGHCFLRMGAVTFGGFVMVPLIEMK